ncbi:MAG: group III truncated hemoglobin [Methylococcaceae bacterium]|nr:group III truncated hemoglobin [Methylococcaceae bacterium]
MTVPFEVTTEQAITELVERFYGRARVDPTLAPIFRDAVADWEAHLRIIVDFWSRNLLGTHRYHGYPYQIHAQLPLKPEHFDRWLELFRQTAAEVLPVKDAEHVTERAEHMAKSFKAGMFSFPSYHGPKIWKEA